MGRLKGQLIAEIGTFPFESREWVIAFRRVGDDQPDRFVRMTHGELQAVARLLVAVAALDIGLCANRSREAALFGDTWYVGDRKIA